MNPFYNILARLNAVTSTTPVETAKPATTVYESVEARGSITEAVKALEAKFATFKESVADDIADAKAEKEAGDWWGDKKKKDDKKDKREVKGSKYGGSKQKDDDEAKDKDDKKDAHHFKKTKKTEILDKDDEDEEDTDKDLDEAFEFGSKNFKNASNLKKAPKAKLVKESAVRNHPIYTNPEAWDHYKKELDEEELTKATQELEEISKLAGLPKQINVDMNKPMGAPAKPDGVTLPPAPIEQAPMLEMDDEWDDESGYDLDDPKHPTWAERQLEKADFARDYARENPPELDESLMNEAASRKDFRMVADLLKNIPDDNKRKELAQHHADIFKQQNPRFSHAKFYAAAGVNEDMCAGADESIEPEVEEGNEFSGALAAAKATGAKDFEVDGKRYTVKEDINVSVTANGEEDALNLFRKLAGMPQVAIAQSEEPCDGAIEVEVDEERDPEYVNSPREQVAPVSAAIPSGNDLHGAKRAYKISQPGDNPMAVAEAKDTSWDKYTSILKGLTK